MNINAAHETDISHVVRRTEILAVLDSWIIARLLLKLQGHYIFKKINK